MKIEMTKVLEYLKPKVKALGFKKEVLEGLAADIAENLEEVEDDASDEDVNAKIKPAVDAVIPSLKLAQRLTNQGIEEYRKKQEKVNEQLQQQLEDVKKPQEPQEPQEPKEPKTPQEPPKPAEPQQPQQPQQPSNPQPPKQNETPEWVKQLIESQKAQQKQYEEQLKKQNQLIETLQAEVSGIKTKDTTAKRRAVLDELLKDTGTFGTRTIKNYERMSFETDEDFDNFISDLKEDLAQLNQERENEGLSKLGQPKQTPEQKPEAPKPKPLTEAEMEELADTF